MSNYSVYCLCDDKCKVVYVGSTTNLVSRVEQHILDNKLFTRVFYIACDNEADMLNIEKGFISKFKPDYNRTLYSKVSPNECAVDWLELDKDLFIHKATYRNNLPQSLPIVDQTVNYYPIHKSLMGLRFTQSKSVQDGDKPVRVEITSSDKLIYCYMKERFDFCTKNMIKYIETQTEIAYGVGVTYKTVSRFIKKMETHGFIGYTTNNAGNKATYLYINDLN